MKNSVGDRIKITKTGKLLRRPMGIGHSRTRKSAKHKQYLRKQLQVNRVDLRMFKKYL